MRKIIVEVGIVGAFAVAALIHIGMKKSERWSTVMVVHAGGKLISNIAEHGHNNHDVNKVSSVWENLPVDLVESITDKLASVGDFIRLGAVSKSWRSFYVHNHKRLLPKFPPQPPHLMIPTGHNFGHDFHQIYLPLSDYEYCISSSHGWLLFINKSDFKLHLHNPFLSDQKNISLPPLTSFQGLKPHELSHDRFLQKVVISQDRTSSSIYAIMVIYYYKQSNAAFYKPGGDYTWTSIPRCNNLLDIVYYKNEFYVAFVFGIVQVINLRGKNPVCRYLKGLSPEANFDTQAYLVESLGELLHVTRFRYLYKTRPITIRFQVCKVDTTGKKLVKMSTLNGEALFLGNNASYSFSASSCFPEYKPDHIYFSDDCKHLHYSSLDFIHERTTSERPLTWPSGPCSVNDYTNLSYRNHQITKRPNDLGVFNLIKGAIEELNPLKKFENIMPPPIWVEHVPQYPSYA